MSRLQHKLARVDAEHEGNARRRVYSESTINGRTLISSLVTGREVEIWRDGRVWRVRFKSPDRAFVWPYVTREGALLKAREWVRGAS